MEVEIVMFAVKGSAKLTDRSKSKQEGHWFVSWLCFNVRFIEISAIQ